MLGGVGVRYSQARLELHDVSVSPPPQFEVLYPRNPTSCRLFPVDPSSLVAPLVKEVVVVLLVVVAFRSTSAEGLRCCELLINCVMGMD